MRIFLVAGTRPNFMKIAPLLDEMRKYPKINPIIVHTGQHYDYEMSAVFFEDLDIPKPDIYLGVGSGTHGEQTGRIIIAIEREMMKHRPDLVVVVGDVNSTLAASVVASKLYIPVAHIEAGLRSFDRTMPEEINRQVTDVLSDYLFTTEESGNENLRREGIPGEKIHFVGDIMIEALINAKCKMQNAKLSISNLQSSIFNLQSPYALLTLHRPSNVDDKDTLSRVLEAVDEVSRRIPIIFPIHPRTVKMVEKFGLSEKQKPLHVIKPLGYLDFIGLEKNARFVLTDSGSMQAETTYFGIPCLTIRENTERPVTITMGTNKLVGTDKDRIVGESLKILAGEGKKGCIPPLWDGKTAGRVVAVILRSELKEK
ncbi:UDP-N-acetylglucosamine 2-epimerase (non-hydrolyzing) [candidate division WOR-3 bacterium JGI_Cruoil_03_44_89]|uniref:UDP-N-acetylglucosamine 2-epimerase (Non-hydrolyzing) n=1 Tax=candidate division WOR-3 bacterium JGI_Cruoil_03_44_89 TaxID=1973748 RepID=A0A235BRL8_UNCW3|nr:MAG: UDP-N-acetylglucosamine 2-epimerase (non-hydrolyzing) [candidate division WOR-3 bacterium JGI_Cruoil_03_44_89]